ncbi:MAG: AAA family ATPase [Spirochaetales bacterium]|nr:AAA family ATPase [Spirochaetales bacterium]
MFLKSLEIFGFKSFADRSRIEFQNGISALLGPNGCGKSNVVDAIKWVIGEQSVKSLRAEKMEDIIFNGTEGRKPLNIAEVTIVLSNDSGVLPLDMPEIEVKRRLYRTGESEYFINNTPAKLREVREMFFDTGIGKSAYSVMEQGRIDQILSSKPEERRYIFEEAAGITKYKAKGAEAERKLARTEENMRQIESILSEVKRSYNTLKVQAEKTETYKELKIKSFEVELDIQLLRLRAYLEQKNESENKRDELLKNRDQLKEEIDGINDFLQDNMDEVNSMESSLVETQKKLYGMGLEKSSSENQLNILAERREELKKQEASCRDKERAIKERADSLKNQIIEKEEALTEYTRRIEEIDANIKEFESRVEAARARIKQNEAVITKRESRIRELGKIQRDCQQELDSLTEDIVEQLDVRLKETGYSHKERHQTEEKVHNLLKQFTIQLDGKVSILKDAAELKTMDKKELQKMLGSAADSLLEIKDGLSNLGNVFTDYSKSIPSFLDEFLAPEGIITKKREVDEKLAAAQTEEDACRSEVVSLSEENKGLNRKIDEYRKTLEELKVSRMQLITSKKGMEESINLLRRDLKSQETLLIENKMELDTCLQRGVEINRQIQLVKDKITDFIGREKELQKDLKKLEEGINSRNKNLVVKEKKQHELSDRLLKVQENLEKIQINLASQNTDIRNLYENFAEKHSRDLSEFDSRTYEIQTTIKDLREDLSKMREKEKGLGQINLMAPEEFNEVKERHDFLNGQLEDLVKGKEDLEKITSQIRKESTELFIKNYDKIRKNFHVMFRRLFGGGRAEIKLMDPNEILTTGIEIYAQPPGKNLENINLLSGGEKSLTAVALLFATYMVKPSPFCILDEIDAALDEQNIGRFGNLLMEFGDRSQFIIITHNKKTVASAKTLLGVTMEESGVSKLVAVRLETKEREPV